MIYGPRHTNKMFLLLLYDTTTGLGTKVLTRGKGIHDPHNE